MIFSHVVLLIFIVLMVLGFTKPFLYALNLKPLPVLVFLFALLVATFFGLGVFASISAIAAIWILSDVKWILAVMRAVICALASAAFIVFWALQSELPLFYAGLIAAALCCVFGKYRRIRICGALLVSPLVYITVQILSKNNLFVIAQTELMDTLSICLCAVFFTAGVLEMFRRKAQTN